MGFLAGIGYRSVGMVCVWEGDDGLKTWGYCTDQVLRYERPTMKERKIQLRKDVLRLSEIPEKSVELRRLTEAKAQLAPYALSKEHLAFLGGVLLLPALLVLPAALARANSVEKKDEALKQEALRKLDEIHLGCISMTLTNGAELLLVCLPDVARNLLADFRRYTSS